MTMSIREQLSWMLDEELDAKTAQSLERRLQDNEEAQKAWAALRDFDALAREAFPRHCFRVPEAPKPIPRLLWPVPVWVQRVAAVAATVVIVLGGVYAWREAATYAPEPYMTSPPAKVATAPVPPAAAEAPEAPVVEVAAAPEPEIEERLRLELPKPMFVGTPKNIKTANLEKPGTKRPKIMVPRGCVNLAAGRPVSASEQRPIIGELPQVTDGDKEGAEGSFVEIGPGQQWVQIDLGASCAVHAVAVWHYHSQSRVYYDVIIQASQDPDFACGVHTLFNNDQDNSAGFGAGRDKEYIETNAGRIVDANGVRGRYVRLYSAGNTSNGMNHYIEVEVWGLPLGGAGEEEVSERVPLKLELPKPKFEGTPKDIKSPNLERAGTKRAALAVPRGCVNLAAGRPVAASDEWPVIGELEYVTDGDKEGADGSFVEFGPDLQWVQIDLGTTCAIHAVAVWHIHSEARICHDVVVQAAGAPDFTGEVRTLFNNDHDNSARLGLGRDKEYIETYQGRVIDAKGVRARYVRLYSNGNTSNDMNPYTEVEVWGLPLGGAGEEEVSERVPLKLELPKPMFVGTPKNIKTPNLEKPGTKRPKIMVPGGCVNLAAGRPVSASEQRPIIGELPQVTDGDKEGAEGSFVEIGPGQQWVQIDLGASCAVHAVAVWHYHSQSRVYYDVVVQVANEPDFPGEVHTLFNNDHDNSAGFGAGRDKEYIETNAGRIVDANGVRARYVRLYSNGNTSNGMNHYTEVEVWGLPPDATEDDGRERVPLKLELPKPPFM